MKLIPRLLVLLGALALLSGAFAPDANSTARPLAGSSCLAQNAHVADGYRVARVLGRAARITFVKTTCALARAYDSVAGRDEAGRDTVVAVASRGR